MLRDKQPKVLAELLDCTLFEEPQKPGLGKFFDELRAKWVKQSLQNQLALMNDLVESW